jgi:hypothetical protein
VEEGRVDLAVAGGADALHGAEAVIGAPCAEGAAFFVFLAGEHGEARAEAGPPDEYGAETLHGELGAAAIPVALARAWSEGASEARAGGVRLFRA